MHANYAIRKKNLELLVHKVCANLQELSTVFWLASRVLHIMPIWRCAKTRKNK